MKIMKKLTAIFFVLLLTIGSFAALAESEYGVNPWTDPASKIYVFEDYSGVSAGTMYPNIPDIFPSLWLSAKTPLRHR